MTPEQAIKREILICSAEYNPVMHGVDIPAENIDRLYDKILIEPGRQWDYESEFRNGDVDTDVACESSRHYETRGVAAQMADGTWVGWTYWHGGGKHGNPEEIEWMCHAYFLDVTEEEKVVTVRTFTKRDTSNKDA